MSQAINDVMMQELKDIMEDDFGILIETFLQESQARYDDLRLQITEGDHDGAHKAAHALKGCCANVGAESCVEVCQTVESMLRDGDPSQETLSQATGLVEGLEAMLAETHNAVATWL